MKKRYFYVVASFMRKDKEDTMSKIDFTVMLDDGSSLFPLMEAVKIIRNSYSKFAILETIRFDNFIEISKEDYEAYNKFKGYSKINK